jgi:hypothetical protein
MLRRAIDLGGFHQVIFICHMQLVWELADTIVSVDGGGVRAGDRQAASGSLLRVRQKERDVVEFSWS